MFGMIPYRSNRTVAPRSFFDDFGDNFFRPFFDGMMRADRPMKVDVRDDGDRYTLEAEIPGASRENVQVELNNDVLTISAHYNQEKEDKGEDDRYIYRERRCGSVSRSFNVEGIREEDITAAFKDGVLTLNLPKQEKQALPVARKIEIQ